jgi:hypothetical protein
LYYFKKKQNSVIRRVSSIDQKTDRQRVNEKDFKIVVEDKCSGSIPFFENLAASVNL